MADLLLYDLQTEKVVLKGLIHNQNFVKSIFMFQRIVDDHFVDLFNRDTFRVIKLYYKKYGHAPKHGHFKHYIVKYITYHKNYKTKEDQAEVWLRKSKRLFSKFTPDEQEMLEACRSNLDEMKKARLLQNTLIKAEEKFEAGNFEDAFDLMSRAASESKRHDTIITRGNIVDDIGQHMTLLDLQKAGVIKPYPTGIVGVIEGKGNEFKFINLDDYLDGGLYKGELTLLIGENNIGKSFFLMELAYNSARAGINTVLYTIEMSKIKQQRRIYSRTTGIPYKHFRMGTLTKKHTDYLKKQLRRWEEQFGILEVVAFDEGATVPDIINMHKEIENDYGKKFEVVCIDYLNDLKPIKQYQSGDRDWQAYGDISWALAQWSKYHNDHEGIVVVTANQKRADSKKGGMEWRDAAFSKLTTQHTSIGIGVYQSIKEEDAANGRLRWNLWKARDAGKEVTFITYPNFTISRIWSNKTAQEYYSEP